MNKPTLVVLAAGMGSRYGGLKQVDPVGPCGETILDYSVFDAVKAGFGKVVFVIRKDFEQEFRDKVGSKYEGIVKVEYCFQDIADLPEGFTPPAERVKPWGTAHAVRAARNVVDGCFAAINADDFYGRDAFVRICEFFAGLDEDASSDKMRIAMVGYKLGCTLSENGSVARGICDVDANGMLKGVEEMTKIVKDGDMAANVPEGGEKVPLSLDCRVSMNFWGFGPGMFDAIEKRFPEWLKVNASLPGKEWYLPFVVDELVKEGAADCRVVPTDASWFGVTYREDKPFVMESIKTLVDAGVYPAPLFNA
jgi:choline kinase